MRAIRQRFTSHEEQRAPQQSQQDAYGLMPSRIHSRRHTLAFRPHKNITLRGTLVNKEYHGAARRNPNLIELGASRKSLQLSLSSREEIFAPGMRSGIGRVHQQLGNSSTERTRIVLRDGGPVATADGILTHELQMVFACLRANTGATVATLLEV